MPPAPRQLAFTLRSWGGKRARAGRKPVGDAAGVPHRARAPLASRHPAHVTLKVRPEAAGLRRGMLIRRLRACFRAGRERPGFRLCHFGVLGDHIHLICEAADALTLARGVQGLEVRIARGINKTLGRSGPVLADRYHARALKTPTEVRNALRYVLQNLAHHRGAPTRRWVDPCSSGTWFDGWRSPPPTHEPWMRELLAEPPPVARPGTWLLGTGWRLRGLLPLDAET